MVTTIRKAQRGSTIKWIYISLMHVSPLAQRPFRKQHAVKLAEGFEIETMGIPVLSYRDQVYWIVDGQHRIEALRMNDFGDYAIECEVYEGLTEKEEARMFRRLNDSKNVTVYDDFAVAVFGEEEPQLSISKTVKKLGLKITRSGSHANGIQAVGSLTTAWMQAGEGNFIRTLTILRDSFDGEPQAFGADMVKGTALFVLRYGNQVKDPALIKRLHDMRGGIGAIMRKAQSHKDATDHAMPDCVAGALVSVYNRGAGRGALERWWK